MELVLFIIAMGFVSAAILGSAIQINTGEAGGISLNFGSPSKFILFFIYCMFAGPYLLISNGFNIYREAGISAGALLGCGLVAMIWSMCSGVLVVQILVLAGIVGI